MPAVLCDLDGLLIDSEGLHYEAYKEVLGAYGITLTLEMFVTSWLSGEQYGTRHYLREAGITDSEELNRARNHKSEVFCRIAKGRLKLMPGVRIFLDKVKAAGLPCGVGTGGYQKEYEFSARECGLEAWVDAFVGGDDVARNKPAPDIYLVAAKKLNVPPKDCVVFENSDIGMNAGLNAGMRCIVVPSPYTLAQDFSRATAKFDSLAEIDPAFLFH